MSEPTNAEMAEQEDMALDAQIDAWYDANRNVANALSIFPWEATEIECVPPILVEVDRDWMASDEAVIPDDTGPDREPPWDLEPSEAYLWVTVYEAY